MDEHEDRNIFQKIGAFFIDHLRTLISIIIILLLVGTGVYAYTRDSRNKSEQAKKNNVEQKIQNIVSEDNKNDSNPEVNNDNKASENKNTAVAQPTDKATKNNSKSTAVEKTTNSDEVIVKQNTDGKGGSTIIATAAKGEGVTHLARKAINDYLEKNSNTKLSKEQKVYAETTLKNSHYQQSLNLGEQVSFSGDSVQNTIDSALKLTPNQINAWAPYAQNISTV